MSRLLVCILLCATGCLDAAGEPNLGEATDAGQDLASETGDADVAEDDDVGPEPTITVAIELGPRDTQPFEAWSSGGDVVMVQGPQGGVHTEHSARVTGVDGADDLHLAIIWGEVWRDDLVLARAGWEFWEDQWAAEDAGYEVELPVLIFDGHPDAGPAELRASLELTDGRSVDYELPINLVNEP